MQSNLESMEKFLELDLKIKELIVKMKPQKINYDSHYIIKYVDGLLEQLDHIKDYLFSIVDMLHIFGIKEMIEEKLNEYESKILNCNYDYDRLQTVYEKCILYMTPTLEDILQENFYGASINRNECLVFSKCNTINDILHALHFYVVNNEQYYRGMPIINSKKNSNECNIVLYGKENELSDGLFDNFPDTMDVGNTDILSFDNRMMIMVRDKGHSLSLDITQEDDKYRVDYFIPKVCNVEKVNQLRGVTKLNPETSNRFSSTKGEFVVNRENFISEIIDFIDCVPTDADMTFERGFPGSMK